MDINKTKICVVGLGYIGLPTASLLATKGFKVLGVDIDKNTVDTINQGKIHIHEPDLDVLVKSAVNAGNLTASLKPDKADIFILSVPTPFREGHEPNLDYIKSAIESIAPYLKNGNLVLLESTSPIGMTEKLAKWIKDLRPDLNVPLWSKTNSVNSSDEDSEQLYLAHCPERVLPGQILRELIDNDRVVGGVNIPSTKKCYDFYKTFVRGQVLKSDSRTAELVKLSENAYRDVNIAFANELSIICDKNEINPWEMIKLANCHPRVNILNPGPGVGGHCIAVDPWFIVHSAPKESRLIRVAREVNDHKPTYVINKIKKQASKLKKPVIACLGLSFKANVDDLRESPALQIVESMASENIGKLLLVEPFIKELPKSLNNLKDVELADMMPALQQADIIALLVDHSIFRDINNSILNERIVIDTRGMWQ
ncbi:UDP-N-acetyl-D-mannosamine dehydrogenase [bacterium K02(2017)]|nr:UDP-N-acetyl-D-mannosamine dehydrogenase [bacterium K02(2017)]